MKRERTPRLRWFALAALLVVAAAILVPRLVAPPTPELEGTGPEARATATRDGETAPGPEAGPAVAPASVEEAGATPADPAAQEDDFPDLDTPDITGPGTTAILHGGRGLPPDILAELARQFRTARVVKDPATGLPVPVEAPPPRAMSFETLVTEGHGRVEGTVEVRGTREATVEAGIPVALTGRILEQETGRPIAGAEVILRSTFYTRTVFYDHHLHEVARAVTDADGEFLVDRLDVDPVHFGKGGRVFLSAASPDHAPRPAIPLQGVSPGWRNRLPDLTLTRARHTLRGRVVDRWEGKPVAGGRVVATGEIHPIHFPKDQREALFLSSPHATTDEKGLFVLENVGAGVQTISVHGGDDCAGYLQIVVPVKDEIVLSARQIRGRIDGRVLDEWDRPVPLVMVAGGDNSTHTFEDGRFRLENFRGDVVDLAFTHSDFRPSVREKVADGSREVVVRLTSRLPLVKFRVREHAADAPIPVVAIALGYGEGAPPPGPVSPHYLSAAGVHAVRVPDGAVTAEVSAEGFETTEVGLTGVRDGDFVDVVLRRDS